MTNEVVDNAQLRLENFQPRDVSCLPVLYVGYNKMIVNLKSRSDVYENQILTFLVYFKFKAFRTSNHHPFVL